MDANIELVSMHVEVLLHPRDIGIVHVGSVKILGTKRWICRVEDRGRTVCKILERCHW